MHVFPQNTPKCQNSGVRGKNETILAFFKYTQQNICRLNNAASNLKEVK